MGGARASKASPARASNFAEQSVAGGSARLRSSPKLGRALDDALAFEREHPDLAEPPGFWI